MKIKDLKNIIENLPDDMEVLVPGMNKRLATLDDRKVRVTEVVLNVNKNSVDPHQLWDEVPEEKLKDFSNMFKKSLALIFDI